MLNTTYLFQKRFVLVMGLSTLLFLYNLPVHAFGDGLTFAQRKELCASLGQAGIPAECGNTEMEGRGEILGGPAGSMVRGIVLTFNDPVSKTQREIIKKVVNVFLTKNRITVYSFVALEVRRGDGKIGIIDLR